MKKQGKILVVDDNRNILSSLRLLLDDVFEDVMTLPSPKTMLNVLAQGVDAVLLDMNFVAGINNGNEVCTGFTKSTTSFRMCLLCCLRLTPMWSWRCRR